MGSKRKAIPTYVHLAAPATTRRVRIWMYLYQAEESAVSSLHSRFSSLLRVKAARIADKAAFLGTPPGVTPHRAKAPTPQRYAHTMPPKHT